MPTYTALMFHQIDDIDTFGGKPVATLTADSESELQKLVLQKANEVADAYHNGKSLKDYDTSWWTLWYECYYFLDGHSILTKSVASQSLRERKIS